MSIIELVLLFVLGWSLGVLVNLLADSLPVERRLAAPVCDACGNPIQLTRYFFCEPCGACGNATSARRWIVAWGLGLVFASIPLWLPERLTNFLVILLITYFALVLVIDIEHRLILHPISFTGVLLGAVVGFWIRGPLATLLGGAAGFGIMFVLYLFGELFARVMAKRRGQELEEVALGFGDVNLAGVLGLMLGWPGIGIGLLLAILAGGLVSAGFLVTMLVKKNYTAFTALPYAPFLIFAACILLFR